MSGLTGTKAVKVLQAEARANSGTGREARNPAWDFTKGMLVLFMVLYHWLNYFVGLSGDIYKYLRFLTPSFIFISGFLISNVSLAKYGAADARLAKRLMHRGLKILGVFALFNALIMLVLPHNGRVSFDLHSFAATLATGNVTNTGDGKGAAFPILVPIAYLLLASAGLVILTRWYRNAFQAACGICFLMVLVLGLNGWENANLELLAVGCLGVVCGFAPTDKINAIGKNVVGLGAAYLVYGTVITVWGVGYPLQVIGVFLTVALFYALGASGDERNRAHRVMVTLGKYSLFAYIVQIVILFILYRAYTHVVKNAGTLSLSLGAAFALTVISVEAVNWARKRNGGVDWLYKAVFA